MIHLLFLLIPSDFLQCQAKPWPKEEWNEMLPEHNITLLRELRQEGTIEQEGSH